jgi:hypothetical protein
MPGLKLVHEVALDILSMMAGAEWFAVTELEHSLAARLLTTRA